MKDVTLAALDRITKEMEGLSESVQRINERQAHIESVLKLGPMPIEEQMSDLGPGGQPIELGWRRISAISFCAGHISMCSRGGEWYTGNTLWGSSNHNMASDFRVSSRSNENTDG